MKKLLLILSIFLLFAQAQGQSVIRAQSNARAIVSGGGSSTLLNNLSAYWKLDEAVGTGTANDETANNNDGTVTSATQSATGGVLGGAVTFAPTQKIDCGDGASLDLLAVGTLSLWVNPSTLTSDMYFLSKGNATTDRDGWYLMLHSGDYMKAVFGSASAAQTATTSGVYNFTAGNWHHVVVSWNSTYIDVYVDASRKVHANQTVVPTTNDLNFHIGKDAGYAAQGLNGLIDEVGVWKRYFSQEGVDSLYNSGTGITYPFN